MDTTGAGAGILGLILGFILLVIGIVWLIFPFIVNSWLKKIHAQMEEATEETRSLKQETIKTNQLLTQSLAISKNPPAATRNTAPVPVPVPAPVAQAASLRVSKDGKDYGEHTVTVVKQMLKNRQLTPQDMYFDTVSQEWITLDLHPALY